MAARGGSQSRRRFVAVLLREKGIAAHVGNEEGAHLSADF